MIRIIVDTKNLKGRLKKIEKSLGIEIPNQVVRAAEVAKATAVRLVPKDTRKTMQGIKGSVIIKTNNVSEARVGFWANPHPEKRWNGQSFNLPYWMTYSTRALDHPWRSGNPRFLLIAKAEAFDRFKRGVRLELNKALK